MRPLKQMDRRTKQWNANRSIDTQNSLDPITIAPDQYFDMKKTADLSAVQSRRASCRRAYGPQLVIGNPPYGVKVVQGDHYSDVYKLGSKDSYGYFIVNALERLKEGGRVVFIVSSSFLTIESHLELRRYILNTAKIVRLVKVSRSMFPGIDVFPVIIELEKCQDAAARAANVYQFFDFWQLHPVNDAKELETAYKAIRADSKANTPWPFLETRTARYTVRQGRLEEFSRLPFFEARASLFGFMRDIFPSTIPEQLSLSTVHGPLIVKANTFRERHFVKLADIAEVKIGLQSGDNQRFYRAAKGVTGGAAKGGYKEVDPKVVLDDDSVLKVSQKAQRAGIEVDDPSTDRYFLPLDKPGVSDIAGGMLPLFWRPVEFYVNWSAAAVAE